MNMTTSLTYFFKADVSNKPKSDSKPYMKNSTLISTFIIPYLHSPIVPVSVWDESIIEH